jgi:hypothetical protein
MLSSGHLDAVGLKADRASDPLVIPWPMPGNLGGFLSFATFAEWQRFVLRFDLHPAIPQIVSAKFGRAHKLHLLAWVDLDLIKAGELVALTALELALRDRYGEKVRDKRGNIGFPRLLQYMVRHDDLTDDQVLMIQRCGGGSVVPRLTGQVKPSLADIRNGLAHGDPFDGWPQAGLVELVRDLIEYAYRNMIDDQHRLYPDRFSGRRSL